VRLKEYILGKKLFSIYLERLLRDLFGSLTKLSTDYQSVTYAASDFGDSFANRKRGDGHQAGRRREWIR